MHRLVLCTRNIPQKDGICLSTGLLTLISLYIIDKVLCLRAFWHEAAPNHAISRTLRHTSLRVSSLESNCLT
jgi:hypothetical protein